MEELEELQGRIRILVDRLRENDAVRKEIETELYEVRQAEIHARLSKINW